MSKYTITVYDLGRRGFDFGLKDYPIFDESYRPVLNKLILDYYMMYEIGFETPLLFKHYLNTKMDLIMPKYNEMYKVQVELMKDGPFSDVDLNEDLTRNVENTANSNSSSQGNNKNLFQDTPQGKISQTGIDNQEWATNLTLNKNEITDNTNSNGETLEEYTKHIYGRNGKQTKVEQYKTFMANFRNINQEIINELYDLFMGVL